MSSNTPFSGEGSRGSALVGRDAASKVLMDTRTGEMLVPLQPVKLQTEVAVVIAFLVSQRTE